MTRILIFTIFAGLLLPHAHFSSEFTKLSFIWHLWTFSQKKFFRWSSILAGQRIFPGQRIFFRKIIHAKRFIGFICQYFVKIPKGGVRKVLAASSLLLRGGVEILIPFILGAEIWKCSMFWHFGQKIGGIKLSTPLVG